jgi:hypothetical protein
MNRSLPFPDLTDLRLPGRDEVERLVAQVRSLDLPKLDLPKVDLPKVDLPKVDLARLGQVAEDAAYITVGLGVLGVQKLQVRRREMMRARADRRS